MKSACRPVREAGSHLDLGPFGHNVPVTANHPHDSGDLINLRVGSSGGGLMTHVPIRRHCAVRGIDFSLELQT